MASEEPEEESEESSDVQREALGNLKWAKAYYFIMSGSFACFYAFFTVILHEYGFTPSQIGLMACTAPLLRCVGAPLWTGFADAYLCHKKLQIFGIAVGTAIHCLFPFVTPTLASLMPLYLISEVIFASVTPIADSACMLTLEKAGLPATDYGKQRMWGAVGWGYVFSPALGAVLAETTGRVHRLAPYVSHAACSAIGIACALRLSQPTKEDIEKRSRMTTTTAAAGETAVDEEMEEFGVRARGGCAEAAPPPHAGPSQGPMAVAQGAWACLRDTPGAPIRLFIFLLSGSCMGTIDNLLFVDLADQGGSTLIDGLALTVTCLSEVAIFYHAGAIQAYLGIDGCIYVTLACYTLRVLYYAALHWIGEPWAVLPVQLLHGITFGLYWSTGCTYARSLAPPALQTTLQGMFQGVNSLGGFLGNLVGGFVYVRFGAVALWLGFSVIMSGGLILLVMSEVAATGKTPFEVLLQGGKEAGCAAGRKPGEMPTPKDGGGGRISAGSWGWWRGRGLLGGDRRTGGGYAVLEVDDEDDDGGGR